MHSVDYTVTFRQKQIHLLGEKSDRSVNYSLFCSALRLSIVLSNVMQLFVEFQKAVVFPYVPM